MKYQRSYASASLKKMGITVLLMLLGCFPAFNQGGVSSNDTPRVISPDTTSDARVKITNKCPYPAHFYVTNKDTAPWIVYNTGSYIDVGIQSSGYFGFQISTRGRKPGTYRTTLSAECQNCKDCNAVTQTEFPISITIPGDEEPKKPDKGGAFAQQRPSTGSLPTPGLLPSRIPDLQQPGIADAASHTVNPNPEPLPAKEPPRSASGPTQTASASAPSGPPAPASTATPVSADPILVAPQQGFGSLWSNVLATLSFALGLGGMFFGGGKHSVSHTAEGTTTAKTSIPTNPGTAKVTNTSQGTSIPVQPVDHPMVPPLQNTTTPSQPVVAVQDPQIPSTPVEQHIDAAKGTYGVELDWPDSSNTLVVQEDTPPSQVGQPVVTAHTVQAQEPVRGTYGVELDWPVANLATASAVMASQEAPLVFDREKRADATPRQANIVSADYVDPTGQIHHLVPVQPGSEGFVPGSFGGVVMPVYPVGGEPKRIINPKTGQLKWVLPFRQLPEGWVDYPQLMVPRKGQYVGQNGQIFNGIPDKWMPLQNNGQHNGSNPPKSGVKVNSLDQNSHVRSVLPRNVATVSYEPGKEPQTYVNPQTGELRQVFYGQKPPDGWQPLGTGNQLRGDTGLRQPLANLQAPGNGQLRMAGAGQNAAQVPQNPPAARNGAGAVVAERLTPAPAADPTPHTVEKPGTGNPNAVQTTDKGESKITTDTQGHAVNSPQGVIGLKQVQDGVSGGAYDPGPNDSSLSFPTSLDRNGNPVYVYVGDGSSAPNRPLTQEDLDRIKFINDQKELAYQARVAAGAQGLTELEQAFEKQEKMWTTIAANYSSLAPAFIKDLDDLRQLVNLLDEAERNGDGPTLMDAGVRGLGWLNDQLPTRRLGEALFGLSNRDLDQYGLIASLRRSIDEHQRLIALWFSNGGSNAVNEYRDNEAKFSLYGAVPGMVASGVMAGLGATKASITARTGIVFDNPWNYWGGKSKMPAVPGEPPSGSGPSAKGKAPAAETPKSPAAESGPPSSAPVEPTPPAQGSPKVAVPTEPEPPAGATPKTDPAPNPRPSAGTTTTAEPPAGEIPTPESPQGPAAKAPAADSARAQRAEQGTQLDLPGPKGDSPKPAVGRHDGLTEPGPVKAAQHNPNQQILFGPMEDGTYIDFESGKTVDADGNPILPHGSQTAPDGGPAKPAGIGPQSGKPAAGGGQQNQRMLFGPMEDGTYVDYETWKTVDYDGNPIPQKGGSLGSDQITAVDPKAGTVKLPKPDLPPDPLHSSGQTQKPPASELPTPNSPQGQGATVKLPKPDLPPDPLQSSGETQKPPASELPAQPLGGRTDPVRMPEPPQSKPSVTAEQLRPLSPAEQVAREQATNEDFKNAMQEDAERAARGEQPRIPKFRQLPRKVDVPPGRESKGPSAEDRNSKPVRELAPGQRAQGYTDPPELPKPPDTSVKPEDIRVLTPEERAAWEAPVEAHDADEWGTLNSDQLDEALERAQAEANRRAAAGAETRALPPRNSVRSTNQPQEPVASPKAETPDSLKQEKPQESGQNDRRARWQAVQGAKDVPDADYQRYAPAIEEARQEAGGPGGACEAAKEVLRSNRDLAGAKSAKQWVGRGANRFQHEFVITKEGYVIDPVAKQFVDRKLTTWSELEARGLRRAVERGIFTQEQWARLIRLG